MRAKALSLVCVGLLALVVSGSATVTCGQGRAGESDLLWDTGLVLPFRVSVGADVVSAPAMAFNPRTSEYLVVWTDERSGKREVWGTVIDPDGNVEGYWPGPSPDDTLISDERPADSRPAVACGDDGYFVVWGGEVYEDMWVTYGRQVSDSGRPTGEVSQVLAGYSEGGPTRRMITYNGQDDEYLVIETVEERGGRVSASGDIVGSVEVPSIEWPGWISDVCYNSTRNEYLVLYSETRGQLPDPVDFVEVQRLSSTGNALGDPIELATVPSRHDWLAPGVVAHSPLADEYLATWGLSLAGVGYYYRGCLLAGDGIPSGGEFTIQGETYSDSPIPAGPIVYNSVADEYLAMWGEGTMWSGTRPAGALRISSDGASIGEVIPYGADAAGYCPASDRYLLCRGEDGNIRCRYLSGDGSTAGIERPIVGPYGTQSDVAISYHAGADQYLAVWRDTRSDQDGDVYGQRIGPDGVLLGSNFSLGDSYSACHPAVAYNDLDEEWLVVWQETSSSGGGWLRGRRVSVTGELLGERFDADVAYYQSEASPAVAYNGSENEYLVVWSHTDAGEMHGRRVAADGSAAGSAILIAAGQYEDLSPAVAYNGMRNEYLVVWGNRHSVEDHNTYGRRVLADGTMPESAFVVGSDSYRPEVACNDRDNQYLVVWTNARGGPCVRMQRVSGTGAAVGGSAGLWDCEYYSCDADVAYSPSEGRYMGFCWSCIGQDRWELSVWSADATEDLTFEGKVWDRTPLITAWDVYQPGIACSSARPRCMLVWEESSDIWGGESSGGSATPTPTCTATSVAVATPTPTETLAATPTSTPAEHLFLPLVLKAFP